MAFAVAGGRRFAPRCGPCRSIQNKHKNAKVPADQKRSYDREWYHKSNSSILDKRRSYRQSNPLREWCTKCIHSKKAAGHEVLITWPEVQAILKRQRNRCALTKLPFWSGDRTPGSAAWDSPSMDRIDHGGPYSAENVRIVLHSVNTFRGRMSDEMMYVVAEALVARKPKVHRRAGPARSPAKGAR